jgi:hypothetical protein
MLGAWVGINVGETLRDGDSEGTEAGAIEGFFDGLTLFDG